MNIQDFVNQAREGNRLEFKAAQSGLPQSLWETYSSFGNTDGGMIILGAVETKNKDIIVTGLPNAYKTIVDFWNGVNDPSTVSENILHNKDVAIQTINGKEVVVIEIPTLPRFRKPVFIHNDLLRGTFKRNNEGDYHCSREEIQAMLRDQTSLSLDFAPVEEKGLEALGNESVADFRNRFLSAKPNHVFLRYNNEEFLKHIKAAVDGNDGKTHPTHAGLLMFGRWQEIVDVYPTFFLDYQDHRNETPSIRWTDRVYSSEGNWSGNVCDFYFRIVPRIVADLPLPFKLRSDGVVREDDTNIRKAIREALTNALVNADYSGRMGVVIKKYENRICFENPGIFRIPINDAVSGGFSDPRNLAMMSIFNLVNVGEKQGGGIPLMFEASKDEGFEKPSIQTRSDLGRTSVTVFLTKAGTTPITTPIATPIATPITSPITTQKILKKGMSNYEKILILLTAEPFLTLKELAGKIGTTYDGAKFLVNALTRKGIILRVGSNRNGKWVVLKK